MAYGSSAFGSETYGGSSNITPAGQVTFFLEGVLTKSNIIKTFALDTRLILRNSNSFSLDVKLVLRNLFTFNLNSGLQKTFLKTFTINAYLKLFGTEKTYAIDSRLIHRRELNFTLDGARRKTQSNTFTISARAYIIKYWYLNWKHRKNIIIDGSSSETLLNYQMKYTIHKGSGIDTTTDIYCGNINDDFSDLRFTKQDGKTLLNYWIQEYTAGDNAIVWVKIDYIPISPNQTNIYLYYGKPGVVSASDVNNTMIYSDLFDGDLSKWEYPGTGVTVNISSNKLHLQVLAAGARGFGGARTIAKFSKNTYGNYAVEFVNVEGYRGDRGCDLWFGVQDTPLTAVADQLPRALYIDSSNAGINGFMADNSQALTPLNLSIPHNFTIEWFGTYANLYIDNTYTATDTVSDGDLRIFYKIENETGVVAENVYLGMVFVRKTSENPPTINEILPQESLTFGRNIMRTHRVGMKIFNG